MTSYDLIYIKYLPGFELIFTAIDKFPDLGYLWSVQCVFNINNLGKLNMRFDNIDTVGFIEDFFQNFYKEYIK